MIRYIFAIGMAAIALTSGAHAGAGERRGCIHPGYDHLPRAHRHRAVLSPQIPYRDPCYSPAPRMMRTIYGPPVVLGLVPMHNPNAPVFNEPPPRFSQD